MSKTPSEQAAQLREAADIIESGDEWEVRADIPTAPWSEPSLTSPLDYIRCGDEIRRKPFVLGVSVNGFALGPRQKWCFADSWTKADLPPPFRPVLDGEPLAAGDEGYYDDKFEWTSHPGMFVTDARYRTTRPLPITMPSPVMVPLGAGDVPPGSVLRGGSWPDGRWAAIVSIGIKHVHLAQYETIGLQKAKFTFDELMNMRAEIKRPGENWKPCRKEA